MSKPRPPVSPVRPRDAASLIVVRCGRQGLTCLMGRRRGDARFLPGCFVFPGGAVESADRKARPASRLEPSHLGAMGVGGNAAATALAVAAVRETWEEAGVMIATPGDVGAVPGAAFDEMRRRGVAPALGRLVYLGRAITPSCYPIRFHARFFLTFAGHGRGGLHGDTLDAGDLGGSGELDHLSWVPLADVASLPTVDVTRFMAGFAGEIIDSDHLRSAARPVFSMRGRYRLIRYL